MDYFKGLLLAFMITCLIVLVGNWMKCLEIICF